MYNYNECNFMDNIPISSSKNIKNNNSEFLNVNYIKESLVPIKLMNSIYLMYIMFYILFICPKIQSTLNITYLYNCISRLF